MRRDAAPPGYEQAEARFLLDSERFNAGRAAPTSETFARGGRRVDDHLPAHSGHRFRRRKQVAEDALKRAIFLMPVWREVLEHVGAPAHFAITLRNPLEVARSPQKRDALPVALGCLLWLEYLLKAERATRGAALREL